MIRFLLYVMFIYIQTLRVTLDKDAKALKVLLFTQQIESKRTKAQNLSSMKNIVMTTMPSLSRNLLSCNTDK